MRVLRSLYLTRRLYLVLGAVVVLFVGGYFVPVLAAVARVALVGVAALFLADLLLVYRTRQGLDARREMPRRLSNGDENVITIYVESRYRFPVRATVIDELPVQFQKRDATYRLDVPPGGTGTIRYTVRPTKRGAYAFGALNVYAASPLKLVERRFRFEEGQEVPVYPSYQQMRTYELLAASNRLEEAGVKKQRRVGHTMEFDHIRPYVRGDDYRTINWNATARRGGVMVNQYREERGRPVYCLLDMGRVMKMPFEGMTLLDYSINASLVLSNVALQKQDRAGLIAFSREMHRIVPAERRERQIYRIQEALYKLETDFMETDYRQLATFVRRKVRRRGLFLLFTNFETQASLRRQLPYLRALARRHTVVAIFFENTALRTLLGQRPEDTEAIYVKTIAEQFAFEKRQIVRVLRRHGIQSVLTPPERLTTRTLNKYLELKARGEA